MFHYQLKNGSGLQQGLPNRFEQYIKTLFVSKHLYLYVYTETTFNFKNIDNDCLLKTFISRTFRNIHPSYLEVMKDNDNQLLGFIFSKNIKTNDHENNIYWLMYIETPPCY